MVAETLQLLFLVAVPLALMLYDLVGVLVETGSCRRCCLRTPMSVVVCRCRIRLLDMTVQVEVALQAVAVADVCFGVADLAFSVLAPLRLATCCLVQEACLLIYSDLFESQSQHQFLWH